ncbi:MAG TPA: family 10 glycosylhydrolase [Vicinamibacterales bacterium]|jgi:uncharacterized lipoprotein YddW (UPF0748 family)
MMFPTGFRRGRRIALLAIAATAFVALGGAPAAGVHAQPAVSVAETRALWVLRSSLNSPASIATLVRTAREQGFNTLLVQVRGRGDAYYTSAIEPRAADLARQPASFDPLATLLADAHAAGLRVHAWVSVNLISSAVDLPVSPEHLLARHPEWLMVPRPIAQELAHVDPTNPGYAGRIARWTRGQLETVEGLYVSPVTPAAVAYFETVVTDLARRYDIDGVHLDYARFPNPQFDYSRFAIAEFRGDLRPRLAAAVRAQIDAAAADDLFAYPDRFPAEWKAFRRARMTALVAGVRQALRAVKPSIVLSAAVAPDPQDAAEERLQDWRAWLADGLVDAIAPMAYTQEPARFVDQIAAVREAAGAHTVWAGIGAYRLSPAQTIEDIQAARRLGTAGFVLFSYDSLIGAKEPDYLARVSRGAFAASATNPQATPR